MLAAEERTTPVFPLAASLLQTRVRASGTANTALISPWQLLSSTSRQACAFWYDGTAAGRLVGLDFFGARYFSGAQGRFTSPDWSEKPEGVPYADFKDPQTLNLYGYLRNSLLSHADPDGHCDPSKGPCPPPPPQSALPKPPAMVEYNGHTVTDARVKKALAAVSVHFASSTVNVTSGDRNFIPTGGATHSAHLTGQAADFHVVGRTDTRTDQDLKESISPVSTGFRLIQHGPDTATEGPHLHLDSRNDVGQPTVFMHEGMTPKTTNVYSDDANDARGGSQ